MLSMAEASNGSEERIRGEERFLTYNESGMAPPGRVRDTEVVRTWEKRVFSKRLWRWSEDPIFFAVVFWLLQVWVQRPTSDLP